MLLLESYLFIDIETVSEKASFDALDPLMQGLWERKASTLKTLDANDLEDAYQLRAGIFAEFSKVVCITIGRIVKKEKNNKLYIKSFAGDDEKIVLTEFAATLHKLSQQKEKVIFCGHNIKEFDIPFLCRRMVVHNIALPEALNISGLKPWEVLHEDTMELWRFGDKKNFTPLALLAAVLGIPTPKDDIDGSMVGKVYWLENDLQRIVTYCGKDVLTVALVFLRLKGITDLVFETEFL
jgi:hypothetical protein